MQKAQALRRLGHDVAHVDIGPFSPSGRFASSFHYHTGALLAAPIVSKRLLEAIADVDFELVWVDGGRLVGPQLVRTLRLRAPVLIYNHDDPFGKRDGFAWALFKRAVPEYDLVCVVRKENVAEAMGLGARKVVLTFRTADEVAHRPRELSPEERAAWASEVVFAGAGWEGRRAFMARLLELKVPLAIYGDQWASETKRWAVLRDAYRGPSVFTHETYTAAILAAKVSLGLVSHRNRDLHTTRSLEIPAMGGLFCARRTSEHLELYREGEEAMFWDTAEECAEVCHRLLKDAKLRERVARQGHERCVRNGHYNEPLARRLIGELGFSADAALRKPGMAPAGAPA
jgi:hypothetical protein